MLKKVTLLVAAPLITGLLGFSLSIALADTTPPAIASTGSTYNVGTGSLVISGSNVTAKTTDFNLAKISVTDGINNTYTLTTNNKGITFPTTGTVAVNLNAADELALSHILDKDSTTASNVTTNKALNSGNYQINVLNGWDGVTSTTDLSAHALTVSGVVSLTSATYDMAGNLKLTGTDFVATSGSKTDITPKYLTISDGATKSYSLTSTGIKITNSTSATVILNAADKLAVQSIFNNAGSSVASNSGNTYNITASYGWDGKLSIAQMGAHAITVSGNTSPIATVSSSNTVVYGKPITGITVNKVGTVYVVPIGSNIATQAALEVLVKNTVALKATVSSLTATISIPTASSKTNLFKFTSPTLTYEVVEADLGGILSSASTNTITINNVSAPTISAKAAKGTTSGTKVTATVVKSSADTFAYQILSSSATITTPYVGTDESSAITAKTITNNYSSGTDITGVDATANNKLAIYELDANLKVVRFQLFTLSATNIMTPVISIAAIPGVTAPVTGQVPVTTITATSQYTGTISWAPSATTFAASTAYTATITITPKAGFSLAGVARNFFTVSGATTVTNTASAGTIKAVFPVTAATGTTTGTKTATVGTQSGKIAATTASQSATFAVTTANIADNNVVTIEWFASNGTTTASAPTGVTADATNVASNASTITVSADDTSVAGTYYFKAEISGVTSTLVTVTVSAHILTQQEAITAIAAAVGTNNGSADAITIDELNAATGQTNAVAKYLSSSSSPNLHGDYQGSIAGGLAQHDCQTAADIQKLINTVNLANLAAVSQYDLAHGDLDTSTVVFTLFADPTDGTGITYAISTLKNTGVTATVSGKTLSIVRGTSAGSTVFTITETCSVGGQTVTHKAYIVTITVPTGTDDVTWNFK